MIAGDMPKALTAAAIAEDAFPVEYQRIAPDVAALELGSPHAGSHPLDDQVAFELRDRTDDDHDGPAQRAGRIDRFAEADELDVETVELIQDLEEVPGGAGYAIAGPYQDDIELAAAGIPHQIAEPWPAGLHAADPVRVLLNDLVAALSSHLS